MDSCGFDKLSKAVAAGASRRTIVRMLAGGLFGGIATVAGGGGVDAAACRSSGRLCNKGANCCSDVCCDNRCVSQNSTSAFSVANCGACGRDCSGLGGGIA